MRSQTLQARDLFATLFGPLTGLGLRARKLADAPLLFAVSYVPTRNLNSKIKLPFVPRLQTPLMLISFLKSYYSGLMVGMGVVSQECRSIWQ